MEELNQKSSKSKKNKIIAAILISVAIFIVAGVVAAKILKKDTATNTATVSEPAKTKPAKTYESPLDGVGYSTNEQATRHPLAVMIENHPDARPQSGLSNASIVYEAITEGGITRFMAIFGPKDSSEIGPIRSARLFFMDWLKEYDAFYAHAGGNEDALANITKYGILDLNHATKYFYRDNKGKSVASEHTLYSSTEKLYQYASSKKFDISSSNFTKMTYKDDAPTKESPKNVEIDFSNSVSYAVKWSYDASNNEYLRFMGGSEHKDRTTSKQLTAKNIIIQTVSRTLNPTGSYGSQNWVFKTVGSGDATILMDGKSTKATWKKASLTDRTKFYDETGAEIQFNRGSFWYEIVPPESEISFY